VIDLRTGSWVLATAIGGAALACASASGPPRVEILYPENGEVAAQVLSLGLSTQVTLGENWILRPEERGSVAVDAKRGLLYVGGADGSLLALEPELGVVVWELSFSGAMSSAGLIVEDLLVFGTDDGALIAVDLEKREERWRYETDGVVIAAPIEADGVVYFGNSRDQVFALDLRDGTWRWQYERDFQKDFTIRGRAGLAFVPVADPGSDESGVLYTGFDDGRVVAIGSSSGEALWMTNLAPRDVDQSGVFADVDSTPLVDLDAGELVVSGVSSGVHGLSLIDGSRHWSQPFKGGGSLVAGPEDGVFIIASPLEGLAAVQRGGGLRWRVDLDPGSYSTPTVVDDTVFVANSDVGLAAYDAHTGRHLLRVDTGSGVSARPVYDNADERLFAMSNRGVLYGFWVNPR
jgi:outer membrane protein assembly factor BamB